MIDVWYTWISIINFSLKCEIIQHVVCEKYKDPSNSFCSISLSHKKKHYQAQNVKILVVFPSSLDTYTKRGVATGKYLAKSIQPTEVVIDSM